MTKDQNTVDATARSTLSMVMLTALNFINIIVVTAATTPIALGAAVILAVPYYFVTALYRWSARDLSRCVPTSIQ